MPLNPEFKAATLTALRSGKYRQARHTIGSFGSNFLCCIGVAAHANGIADRLALTVECANFIGLDEEERADWIEWNDQKGLTFEQIADEIEALDARPMPSPNHAK